MVLLPVTLSKAINLALASWPLSIQPISLIAVFTTVEQSSMMVPIAGCISQPKWRHFMHRPNRSVISSCLTRPAVGLFIDRWDFRLNPLTHVLMPRRSLLMRNIHYAGKGYIGKLWIQLVALHGFFDFLMSFNASSEEPGLRMFNECTCTCFKGASIGLHYQQDLKGTTVPATTHLRDWSRRFGNTSTATVTGPWEAGCILAFGLFMVVSLDSATLAYAAVLMVFVGVVLQNTGWGLWETTPNLWRQALNQLAEDDRKEFRFDGSNRGFDPAEIVQVVESEKAKCVKKQWVLYTNKAGKEVHVRDILEKTVGWIEKFKEVGDMAVEFDPCHTSVPWMAVKTLLQVAVNDCQTFGAMIESLEGVSSIIARYTELEAKVLIRISTLTKQLSTALVELYSSALRFLAQACRYYGQSTTKRAFKSTFITAKKAVEEPVLRIEKQENEVYKLVCLVQSETTGVDLKSIIESIRQSVEDFHASKEEQYKRFAAWIKGIDTKTTYETALQYHHSGTCEWLLRPSQNCSGSTAQQGLREGARPLSYFFCVADNQLTRDPYAILRSWLMQMLEQDEAVVSVMDAVYKERKKEQMLTHIGLWQLFAAVGEAIEGCTFVVDGFDECTEIDMGAHYHHNEPRNLFLCDLLENLSQTKSRVLVLSRDTPDIREYLGNDSTVTTPQVANFEHRITVEDTTADVRSFSEHVVNNKLSKKTPELRQKLATQAAERSEGMFLWIKLLGQKISPAQNAKQLSKTVTEMPSGISEAYSRELNKIIRLPADEKEKAVMVLRWTLFAVRPLQVKQLVEALVVSDDDLDKYPENDLPDSWNEGFVDEDYVKDMILSRCGSLLQLQSSSAETPIADHTVHFVHFSVKEYLSNLSNGTIHNQRDVDLGLMDPAAEERRLAGICLRYLALDSFDNIPSDTDVYPFLSYAAWAWYFHSFHDKPKPPVDIMYRTQRAFDPATSSWRVWTPLIEAELADSDKGTDFIATDTDARSDKKSDTHAESVEEPVLLQEVPNPIYYAALLGLTDIVKWLEKEGASMRCIWEHTQVSLFDNAVDLGNDEMARWLVDAACRVWDEDSLVMLAYDGDAVKAENLLRDSTPEMVLSEALHVASARGHVEIIELPLSNHAKINLSLRDINGRTALHHATRHMHLDVANLLAHQGAGVSLEDDVGSTPIDLAVRHGKNAGDFIQEHMDDFTLNISRRPSLLGVTPNQGASLTVIGIRKRLSGMWAGHYCYLAWNDGRKDPFSINIPAEQPRNSQPCTFSSDGEDVIGPFQIHGFVDPAGIVWFAKLYRATGWLYRGRLDATKGVLKGTWGSNRKLWFGTLVLRLEE
ncbi:hypothetical protein M406DRAFT_333297 [Cryphonectria parasitica EP155]|uniref:NACHT domain-containing protein n=1 Tax=Cryphonectria parasitica (strain ATCC 38755 / EP155) TaxID=660469 RepID=A0A9P4XX80_CRYP1|nr:uncharacterized protein M406DRAFT_333297 [Cryphonectria parasitica EP155]KAF3762954.1 hypothetical protein M406DRAFT_333297 [Cryphonectria parasitica EP155]